MAFEPLKNVFQRVLAERRVARTFNAAECCVLAEKIIVSELPQITGRIKAKFIKNDILHLVTTSSTVGSEVQLASATILAGVQKRFPKIKKIRISTDYTAFCDPYEKS